MNFYSYLFYLSIIIFIILFLLFKGISDLMSVFFGSPPGESNTKIAKELFKKINLTPNTSFYDLGCGFGNISYIASNYFKAKVTGIDISPLAYIVSRLRNYKNKNVKIIYGNFRKINLNDAKVIYCYLFPGILEVLANKFNKELSKGAIVLSMCFKIPNLKIHKIIKIQNKKIYLYKF